MLNRFSVDVNSYSGIGGDRICVISLAYLVSFVLWPFYINMFISIFYIFAYNLFSSGLIFYLRLVLELLHFVYGFGFVAFVS